MSIARDGFEIGAVRELVVLATRLKKKFVIKLSGRCLVTVCVSAGTTGNGPVATESILCGNLRMLYQGIQNLRAIHYRSYGGDGNKSVACIEFERPKIAFQRYSLVLPVDVFLADTTFNGNGHE